MDPVKHFFKNMNSPVGMLTLIASDKGLAGVLWELDHDERAGFKDLTEDVNHTVLLQAEKQLNEYFDKKREVFSLELDFTGTDFQQRVWKALLEIPYGATVSYGDLARRLGDIKAVRAVGGAVNKNPISIIAPCHRVIGSNGDLVGFGGGLKNKSYLLRLEDRQQTIF